MALCQELFLNLLVRFQHRKKDNRIRACGAIGSVSALQAGGNGIETHLVQLEFFTAFYMFEATEELSTGNGKSNATFIF